VPHVIEPSFGIGRIIYCIFEHCFRVREKDAQRTYFDFPAAISPVKCSLLPLMAQAMFVPKVQELKTLLTKSGLSSKVDDSGQTVGRRYARTDEMGIPYAFTIDHDTLNDNTVTMREMNTMKQIRLPIPDAAPALLDLTSGRSSWSEMLAKYPNVESGPDEDKKE
jgi:glycyl-tRNA synthetase